VPLWFVIILVVYGFMSVLTIGAYVRDKRAAGRGGWRVSERTLHLLELCGGWPGALLASRTIRHKTSKSSYRLAFAAIIVLHLAAWMAGAWLLLG